MAWYAIILCGGSGTRMGAAQNKVLLPVCGKAAVRRAAEAFVPLVDGMVAVCRPFEQDAIRAALEGVELPVIYAPGGDTRQSSVYSGLQALPEACDRVLIHDGARCLVDGNIIRRVMDAAERWGAAAAAIPVTDTIKQVDSGEMVVGTPDRSMLRQMQTPQGFHRALIEEAHRQAMAECFTGTDDAALVERLGRPVKLVEGSRRNLKLTTPEDLTMAEAFLRSDGAADRPALRVGHGMDVHRLAEGRRLVLCGVDVPHTMGLDGHSDADVAVHALMDALLGACALGDIGQHFPDTDERYRGISSMELLRRVCGLLNERGYAPVNADITIAAQRPRLMPFIPQMRANVAEVMGLPEDCVSVKATTTERLGFEGRGEGISAWAVAMVEKRQRVRSCSFHPDRVS